MSDLIRLDKVYFDKRAMDGTWCTLPYPNHPKGCPNFPDCTKDEIPFNAYNYYEWFAVVEVFNLKDHAERMKEKHTHWTERQCRNLLYWQGGVRKRLREKSQKYAKEIGAHVLFQIPEAKGVDVFKTMKEHGLKIQRHPDIVHKVMILGRRYPREERLYMSKRMHTVEAQSSEGTAKNES